ncbi:MAG: thiamine biosynthesis protein ThiS [Hydrogenophilales bacterium 17-61-76]|nr:MAG: thiamine biosynthesis protein ThiS [Hydrogenophilales bacterium 17-61-76]
MSLGSSGNATIRRPPGRDVSHALHINGELRRFPAPLTLNQLIESLDLVGKRIAIERNGEIVPRSQHAVTPLANGDRLEIVVAVGGG